MTYIKSTYNAPTQVFQLPGVAAFRSVVEAVLLEIALLLTNSYVTQVNPILIIMHCHL